MKTQVKKAAKIKMLVAECTQCCNEIKRNGDQVGRWYRPGDDYKTFCATCKEETWHLISRVEYGS